MTNQEWLIERKKGIGGSDAAAVLGVSKWKTPFQLYLEKIGDAQPQVDNEYMVWGRALEPVIRQQYAERTGNAVVVPNRILTSPEYPYMLANLDGITEDGKRIIEIKTSRNGVGFGEPGSDEIPQEYLCQVQHYMTVTGAEVADVAVLIGGSDFRLYEVPADLELQGLMIAYEARFWSQVEQLTPPPVKTYEDVKAKFGTKSRQGEVYASKECVAALNRIKSIKEEIKRLASLEEDEKATVMSFIGEYDTLMDNGSVIATWKATKPSKSFNEAQFKKEHPEMYSQYLTDGKYFRRFVIK